MERFPQAVFIAGGQETIEGRQFTSKLVQDESQLEAALAEGWHETTGAAAEDRVKKASASHQQQVDVALASGAKQLADEIDASILTKAATRAELEAEAAALGVEFSKKLGDAKLAERIAAKKAEQGA